MSEINLRYRLCGEDRSAIEAILRRSGAFREEEIAVGLEIVDETLHPRPDTDYEWILAESSGKVVGFACYGPVPMTLGTYDLYWIAVSTEVRGSGAATKLDHAVEERVRAAKGRWILAETSSTEPYAAARKFYGKNGYLVVETIPDFYRDGDDRQTFGKRI
jgi:ribosomal protein S18 acetylase RimI-like enzyme